MLWTLGKDLYSSGQVWELPPKLISSFNSRHFYGVVGAKVGFVSRTPGWELPPKLVAGVLPGRAGKVLH